MKQDGVAIPMPNKINFKPKLIKNNGEGHFILIKRKIQGYPYLYLVRNITKV